MVASPVGPRVMLFTLSETMRRDGSPYSVPYTQETRAWSKSNYATFG